MTRFLSTLLAGLLALSAMGGGAPRAVAQTPVATADPFLLPINLQVQRITDGNDFTYLRDASGAMAYVNGYLVDDGETTSPVPEPVADMYRDLQIEDMYVTYGILIPDDGEVPRYGIVVDIRLLTFPDHGTAEEMVRSSTDVLTQQAMDDPNASQEISALTDLPVHSEAIAGATGTDAAIDLRTGAQGLFRVPFTRYFAQSGTTVASVKVTSPDPAFNEAVARELLAAQIGCVEADTFCSPIPLPGGVDYAPEMPIASPAALTPAGRSSFR